MIRRKTEIAFSAAQIGYINNSVRRKLIFCLRYVFAKAVDLSKFRLHLVADSAVFI